MKLMLAGAAGQLGWELRRALAPLGEIAAFARTDLDLSDAAALQRAVRALQPDVIVNAAAYTAVDRAETETQAARLINAVAPGVLAEEARRCGALLVHYSTDYVFDGGKSDPYREDDAARPLNAYGRSKLEGEEAVRASACRHFILRTGWMYGARGSNFFTTMLRLAREREELRVVADRRGAPTWSRLVAGTTALLLAGQSALGERAPPGTYHLAAAGETSWHGFAEAILAAARARGAALRARRAIPVPAAEYPLPAQRPPNSLLCCDKLARDYRLRLPDWRSSFELFMEEQSLRGLP